MARISRGILDGFSGTVGTVIGGNWRGINYMRSKPIRKKSYTPTPKQAAQQQKFALVVRFIETLSGLFALSFKNYAVRMTGRNSALSYTLKNAVAGIAPDFELDYTNILISRGELPCALNPAAAAAGAGQVAFSWTNNTGEEDKAKATDRAILVVHCPALNRSRYTTTSAVRSAGGYIMEVPSFSGQEVHTYIGFISEDGELVADSLYTGAVTVA